jgi:hypothetical protein
MEQRLGLLTAPGGPDLEAGDGEASQAEPGGHAAQVLHRRRLHDDVRAGDVSVSGGVTTRHSCSIWTLAVWQRGAMPAGSTVRARGQTLLPGGRAITRGERSTRHDNLAHGGRPVADG